MLSACVLSQQNKCMKTIEIELEPHYELLADLSEVSERILACVSSPLDHQVKTCHFQQDYDLVLNTFPTGTGKTKAALFHLLNNPKAKVLFIAPTNELIDQHYEDVQEFVKSSKLEHLVCKADARAIRSIDPENELHRQGERFYRLITNPLEFAEQLGIPEEERSLRRPIILVTNPDLFYYSLYACYSRLDKRNLFETMFASFEYIIIDEFHYYNAKQLANFLFFLALSLDFGYFQHENRKICLLSATPDEQVYKYLDRLSSQGLKWKEVAPIEVDSNHSRAIRTLAPVKLQFCESDDLDNYLSLKASEIKQRIQNSLDGALISYSLIDVNRAVGHLKKCGLAAEKDFGRITGAVSRKERKQSAKKPLIVATPTVDIGYNFVKQTKTRQNLDFLVFTAKYADEFWQRLGRTGRVLGKPENNIPSEAIALVSSEIFAKLQNQLKTNPSVSREQLKNLLLSPSLSVFPQKPFLNEYISSYSVLESFRPLYELRQQIRSEERIQEVFERVREIFAPNSKRGYRYYVGSIARFNSLQAAKNNENYSDQLVREFLNSVLFWMNKTNQVDENLFASFKKALKEKKSNSINQIKNYILEEYYALQSLFSFRDSFQSLSCAVYDPHNVISDCDPVVYYDLFHLLKYYNLRWHKSRKEFLTSFSEGIYVNESDLYCQVTSYKEKEENLIISFALETQHEKALFNRRYCDKPIAINSLKIVATKKQDQFSLPLSPNLTDAIEEQYITCLLFPEQGGALGEIQGKTRNMQVSYPLIEVTFSDSKVVKYRAVMGTNAYLLGSRIQRYLYALEKKLEYWIV